MTWNLVTKIEFADHQFRFQFDALDQYDQSHVCACSSTALKNQSKFLPGLFVGLSFALIFNGIGSRRSRSPISNFLGVMHNSTFFLLLHIFPDLHSWKFALYYANTTSEHVPKKSGQSRQFWGLARSLFISLPATSLYCIFPTNLLTLHDCISAASFSAPFCSSRWFFSSTFLSSARPWKKKVET